MFISLCLLSNLLAIIVNANPFIVMCIALPHLLGNPETIGAISLFLILFAPLILYQLYFWWLLLKRSPIFLRVWHGQDENLPKIKTMPLWATTLFLVVWYPLLMQEFLLGHHFYPYKGELSFSFLFSLGLRDAIAIFVLALLSATYGIGLIRLTRIKETKAKESEIYRDNIIYGFVSLCLWASAGLVWFLTQAEFPASAITMLYITLSFTYLPDLVRLIERKFTKGSWMRRIFYYGSPLAVVASAITMATAFSLFDTVFAFPSLTALFALFLFFLWFDIRLTESKST